jgi:hypothetical protein
MFAQPNEYLQQRNKKYYRGHSQIIHPLYDQELKNAIQSITTFLNLSILKQAYYLRSKKLYELTADKCYKNNNYTFSEAETCQEIVFERDPILNNIENYKKELEIKITDAYEKSVKYADKKDFEENHRRFLTRLHTVDRFTYYLLAKNLFK